MKISANEKFYKQEYCGCSYSLRDSNEWRAANGIPKIRIGGKHDCPMWFITPFT